MIVPVPTPRQGEMIRPMPGIRAWRNAGNQFLVVEVHYTADPARRGDWRLKAAPKYGGLRSWRWRKEQEIDWTARSGRLVFENWDEKLHVPRLAFPIPEHWPRWLLVDPGWTNPTSVLWAAVDIDTDPSPWGYLPVHVYREFYERRRNAHAIAHFMHDMSSPPGRNGERALETIEEVIVDPQAKQEHQSASSPEQTDEGAENVLDQLEEAVLALGWDVPVRTGNNHKEEAIVEMIARLANYWVDHNGVPLYDETDSYRRPTDEEILEGAYLARPTLFVHPTCPHTILEMRKYVWAVWASADVSARRNEPEKPMDKDDHSITNLIRFVNELRRLRGDTGDVADPELRDLEAFAPRVTRRQVVPADEVARRAHEQRAARYRRRVSRGTG